ncbi:hypothetical protein BK816_00340 [Boudabousia tangfeifanii]|uniref:HTH gntR-type domain-containing protein n=1 Tax=Boudabousia tangfeifanii TaxID=1912795 RepID=A0A1D9MIA2_9ACTO|nr:GntR family transcriptional regulator [Boudabousia tangfeifanii]AOZ71928.1 hypothetical protein BK816_00340 [Boudabousia tangfeifanii]
MSAADFVIEIDYSSPLRPFDQVRSQLAVAIRSGQLPAGFKLPTVRTLASRLEIANGTVQRAYQDLEAAGLTRSEGRRGTFVADRLPALAPWEKAVDVVAAARGTEEKSETRVDEVQLVAREAENMADVPAEDARPRNAETEEKTSLPQHLSLQIEALMAAAKAEGINPAALIGQIKKISH